MNDYIHRKNHNNIPFTSIKIVMQMKSVKRICKKYNIDISNVKIRIHRNINMLDIIYCGAADYNNIGIIDLFPNAFKTEIELIKTILHEKEHVRQLKQYGKAYVSAHLDEMEDLAIKAETNYNVVK